MTDPLNCGGCGMRCPSAGDGSVAVCAAGRCSPGCTSGGCTRVLRTFGGPTGIGTNCLPSTDDGSWAGPMGATGAGVPIDLTMAFSAGVNVFGITARSFFLNNNGNVTFRSADGAYNPGAFPSASQPTIAPLWGDVDTRGGGQPMRNSVCFAVTPGAVVATWDAVGYFATHDDRANTFQVILTPHVGAAATDFDVELRYERCEWNAGDSMGGMRGLATTGARAGFDAGDRRTSLELAMSGTMGVLNLCSTSNVGTPGIWRFTFRGGMVAPAVM